MIYYSADLDSASAFHLTFFFIFPLTIAFAQPTTTGVASGFTPFSFKFFNRSHDIVNSLSFLD